MFSICLEIATMLVNYGQNQEWLDFEAKKLQSIVKEQSLTISKKDALSDKINPRILRYLIFGGLRGRSTGVGKNCCEDRKIKSNSQTCAPFAAVQLMFLTTTDLLFPPSLEGHEISTVQIQQKHLIFSPIIGKPNPIWSIQLLYTKKMEETS
ncbi:hypothetical protein Cgig2_005147 [Carnegiea gigantea]|uniref:Uncharacterized protein n=1 Tax=Carnegiea gigantea TaxID=171969 RepID=A0A9Q1KFC7_9CARY|nr:hypothetical protein Cgig2_005147 [Carnegiea gigantea]